MPKFIYTGVDELGDPSRYVPSLSPVCCHFCRKTSNGIAAPSLLRRCTPSSPPSEDSAHVKMPDGVVDLCGDDTSDEDEANEEDMASAAAFSLSSG